VLKNDEFCRNYNEYSAEQVPSGPLPSVTPELQPEAVHWYQTLSERAWTQVRGGTDLPSVADEHQA
jgi:hypothetical protein